MKYVITKLLEYYSAIEEPPTVVNKAYLCRVVINSDNGRFRVSYQTIKYAGDGRWHIIQGIVTHWAEIPAVYDIDDDKRL